MGQIQVCNKEEASHRGTQDSNNSKYLKDPDIMSEAEKESSTIRRQAIFETSFPGDLMYGHIQDDNKPSDEDQLKSRTEFRQFQNDEVLKTQYQICVQCNFEIKSDFIFLSCGHAVHYCCLRKRIFHELSQDDNSYSFKCQCGQLIYKGVTLLDKSLQNIIFYNQLTKLKQGVVEKISTCERPLCDYFEFSEKIIYCPICQE